MKSLLLSIVALLCHASFALRSPDGVTGQVKGQQQRPKATSEPLYMQVRMDNRTGAMAFLAFTSSEGQETTKKHQKRNIRQEQSKFTIAN